MSAYLYNSEKILVTLFDPRTPSDYCNHSASVTLLHIG